MNKNTTAKDSTSNLFNRYVWLVDLIYRKEKITFEEINEYWRQSSLNLDGEDIPLRTFHNHRKAIEQMFDINIECDRRNGYTYYIENGDDMERGGVRSWLLNTFAVNNLINESHKIKRRILFEKIPSGQKFLIPIVEAMKENNVIEISYHNFWSDSPVTFPLHPYCVKVFKQRWYVVGFNPDYDEVQIYALDRIESVSLTEEKFKFPNDFDGETFFYDCYGIIAADGKKEEKVVLKVYSKQDKYFRALPLHHSQKEGEKTAEYTLFSYQIRPSFDFRQEILSHGTQVEVLEPKWFRNEIAEIIREQYATYVENEQINKFENMKIT